jgi:CheY-like chemotaxis protein
MLGQQPVPSTEGRRIVICDYNALLLSVTGLLRMSGYSVFQAHDGWAAQELCVLLPDIDLLVLNTYGTGINVGELCRTVRTTKHGLPILHIGSAVPLGMPPDVPTLAEDFNADGLLSAVGALILSHPTTADPASVPAETGGVSYPNGRRREDSGSRAAARRPELFPAPAEPLRKARKKKKPSQRRPAPVESKPPLHI